MQKGAQTNILIFTYVNGSKQADRGDFFTIAVNVDGESEREKGIILRRKVLHHPLKCDRSDPTKLVLKMIHDPWFERQAKKCTHLLRECQCVSIVTFRACPIDQLILHTHRAHGSEIFTVKTVVPRERVHGWKIKYLKPLISVRTT